MTDSVSSDFKRIADVFDEVVYRNVLGALIHSASYGSLILVANIACDAVDPLALVLRVSVHTECVA
ncbi:MAG TPA: hypothetical protein ACQGQH_06585 [Xylella sp.]